MRIGIDIDNVISNFNEELLNEYLNYDKQLRNTGIINKNAEYIRRGMFDWTEDEEISFYRNNIERIAKSLKVKDGAKEYIDKLIADGHIVYIITGRDNGEYSDPYNMTKKWLDENFIKYHNLILTNAYKNDKHGKTEKCKDNNMVYGCLLLLAFMSNKDNTKNHVAIMETILAMLLENYSVSQVENNECVVSIRYEDIKKAIKRLK